MSSWHLEILTQRHHQGNNEIRPGFFAESSVTYRATPTTRREPNARASGVGATAEPAASADGSRHTVSRRVSGEAFLRGFWQHTLPPGFQRLRRYDFASPNSKLQFAWVRMLAWFYLGWCYFLASQAEPPPITKLPVRCCGHRSPSGGLVVAASCTWSRSRSRRRER